MNYAYIRAGRLKEIEELKSKANADTIMVDLISNWGISSNANLNELVKSIKNGDTVVIKSVDNLIGSRKVDKFSNTEDFINLFKVCKDSSAQLISLQDKGGINLLEADNYTLLSLVTAILDNKANTRVKMGRPSNFPKEFLKFYYKFRNKELDAYVAGKELGINYKTFYSLVKEFES